MPWDRAVQHLTRSVKIKVTSYGSGWRWMTVNDVEWRRMSVNDGGWRWVMVHDGKWWWMTVNDGEWRRMTVNDCGWQWVTINDGLTVNDGEWRSLTLSFLQIDVLETQILLASGRHWFSVFFDLCYTIHILLEIRNWKLEIRIWESVYDGAWRWMTVNDGEWRWMTLNDGEWRWIHQLRKWRDINLLKWAI